MMFTSRFLCAALAAVLICSDASLISSGYEKSETNKLEVSANPIRKVVTMIQKLAEKLDKEAATEEELYKKFECYCKKTKKSLEDAISAAEAVGPITPEDIEAKKNEVKALKDEVKKLKDDKAADEASLNTAKVNRKKEHDGYVKVVAGEKETENAAESALQALGVSTTETPSFVQVDSHSDSHSHSGFGVGVGAKWLSSLLNAFTRSRKVSIMEKKKVEAFLQGKGEAPGDNDAVDVKVYIEDIEHEAEDDIKVEDSEEDKEVVDYTDVKKSKKAEIAALLNRMEKKMRDIGTLEVEIVNMQHDMENGAEVLADNKKMLAEVTKNCGAKEAAWTERKQYRQEEQVALTDTIKMLNSDDALELFKKTIKGPALLQLQADRQQALEKAKAVVDALRKTKTTHRPALNFLALKLSGKKIDFSSVYKKIDEMIVLMKKEQADDDSKKEYCNSEFDASAKRVKDVTGKVEEFSVNLENGKIAIDKLVEEMQALQAGVKDMDASIAEASENRKEQNAESKELILGNSEAVKLLGMAKDRLNHFYNPSLAPNTATTTPNPYALSFAQISEHRAFQPTGKIEVDAPPETFSGELKTKREESNGILHMLDTLVNDLEKEMTVAKTEEQEAQKDYEQTVVEAQRKREADLKSVAGKAKSKADFESEFLENKEGKAAKQTELMQTKKYISDLHGECDWLLENFDLRKQARVEESESMTKAKATLAGANFAF